MCGFFFVLFFFLVSKQLWLFLNSPLKIVQINLALEHNLYHRHSLAFSLEENACTDADVHKTEVFIFASFQEEREYFSSVKLCRKLQLIGWKSERMGWSFKS